MHCFFPQGSWWVLLVQNKVPWFFYDWRHQWAQILSWLMKCNLQPRWDIKKPAYFRQGSAPFWITGSISRSLEVIFAKFPTVQYREIATDKWLVLHETSSNSYLFGREWRFLFFLGLIFNRFRFHFSLIFLLVFFIFFGFHFSILKLRYESSRTEWINW